MWKRPADVPVGREWARFKGRERDGEPARQYVVRDLEEPYREECLAMMERTFINDEPMCQILGVKDDPVSMAEIRANWERLLEHQISIMCLEERDGQPDELVGFNILLVKTKTEPENDINFKGETWNKLLKTFTVVEEMVDVYSHYDVDTYISSSGLTVAPRHRGQNIGARMIAARKELCKAFNIKAVATIFTATTSQVLAAKCSYEVLATLDYSEMKKHGVDLTGCSTPSAIYMGRKFATETGV